MKMLLVEDNPGDALLLSEIMLHAGQGKDISHVECLQDALRLLERDHFDVAFLDLSLPDSEGLDTITRMHAHAPGLPIVVLTGLDDQDLASRALREGAQDYLVKGYGDTELLVRSMRYAIERKRAEETLQKREEHFRSLIENALDIISVLNVDGLIRYASPSVLRVLGWRPEELDGCSFFDYVHGEDIGSVRDLVTTIAGTTLREIRFRHRDGGWRMLEAAGSRYVDESGSPGVILNARDITERKKSEEALRLANQTLSAVIDTSPLAIYTLDRQRRVQSWNPAAERIFGWKREEVIGRPLSTIADADQEETMAQFERMLRGEEILHGREARRLSKDGSMLDVSIWTSPLRHTNGEIAGIMATAADNSQRKQLEEQLRLSQRMEAVGRLAGGVAHDFNNLLTVITGYTDLLLQEMHPAEPLRRQAEEIHKAAARAATLTNQLLAFSRKQVMQPEVLDLNRIVAELDEMLRRLIGEDIQLAAFLDPKIGRIRADPGQIEQVILNLVVNAREAMPGGGKLTIETKDVYLDENYVDLHVGVNPGRYVLLAITDTGHGMDAATVQHIFEPFFTAKKRKGTGLGLATVYGIVKQSGGNVWVYSEPGKGSSFKIYLPRIEDPADSRDPAPPPAAPARAGETILVAEDEDMVRGLVREILQSRGYRVLEARHGAEALEVAARHKNINLLVTDVVMPHMSGRELMDRILPSRPELKVLFISGYTDNAMAPHGILEPGEQFLQKPFTPEALARKVREILDAS
jgi:PAS domain S-box-containing protein